MKSLLLALSLVIVMKAEQNPTSGSIAGTLKTRSGEPVAGIRVAAVAVSESPGPSNDPISLISITQSAPDGSYKLDNIPPGRYYITAGLLNALTYYPSGFDPTHATVINVNAGSVLSGYDFVPKSFPIPLKGRIAMSGLQGASLPRELLLSGAERRTIRISPDGSFELQQVIPGEYTISTVPEFFGTAGNIVLYQSESVNGTAGNAITIDSQDQKEQVVSIVASPLPVQPVKVRGRIVNIAAEAPALAGRRIQFSSSMPGINTIETRVAADNTFEFPKAMPGIYQVQIENLPALFQIPFVTVLNEDSILNIDLRNNPFLEYPASFAGVFGGPSSSNTISLRGVVTEPLKEFRPSIPVFYFRVDVRDEKTGLTAPWAVLCTSVCPDKLKTGDGVIVTGDAARDGTSRLSFRSIRGQ